MKIANCVKIGRLGRCVTIALKMGWPENGRVLAAEFHTPRCNTKPVELTLKRR